MTLLSSVKFQVEDFFKFCSLFRMSGTLNYLLYLGICCVIFCWFENANHICFFLFRKLCSIANYVAECTNSKLRCILTESRRRLSSNFFCWYFCWFITTTLQMIESLLSKDQNYVKKFLSIKCGRNPF